MQADGNPGAMPGKQLWLPGLEAAPEPTDGLFLAVFPDPATATRIATHARHLCGASGPGVRPVAASRLHVTLQSLGRFVDGLPHGLVESVGAAAAAVRMAPFTVAFDRAVSFAPWARSGPLVLCGDDGVVGMHALREAFGLALEQVSGMEGFVQTRYEPHMTLSYRAPWSERRTVETISWTVREFVLVHSLLGRTRHVPLGRWPLHPESASGS